MSHYKWLLIAVVAAFGLIGLGCNDSLDKKELADAVRAGMATPTQSAEEYKKELLQRVDALIATASAEQKPKIEAIKADITKKSAGEIMSNKIYIEQSIEQYQKSVNPVTGTGTTPINGGQSPSGTAPSAKNGGNGTTMTSCGPITWGPAGPAPGTGTSDSAKQVSDAVQLMRVPLESAQHVTIHKFCPGDDTPNGWIVGSSWTEANGVNVKADFLPAGVCVDYDPGVTQIKGDVYHTQVLTPRWSRTQIKSDGSASGLKFTGYWTPCAFTDGTPSWPGNGASVQPTPATPAGCPATSQDVATLTKTPATWAKLANEPCAWVYNGTKVGFMVPQGYEVDYDAGGRAGKKQAGETVPEGIVFTLRKK